ncbi:MAG: hypothetical protein IJZ93_00215 [Clostridia bacterium]|nr:hypothetical protein [Clostridia bacterium]
MKKFLSMFLCLVMLVSTMAMCIIPTSAEGTETETEEVAECEAKLTNINQYDSNGLFEYIKSATVVDCPMTESGTPNYIGWAGSLDYLGMFDGDIDTYTLIKAWAQTGLRVVIEYKEPMLLTDVVVHTNKGYLNHNASGIPMQQFVKLEISENGEDWTMVGDEPVWVEETFLSDEYNAAVAEAIANGGQATDIDRNKYVVYEGIKFELNQEVQYMRVSAFNNKEYHGEIDEIFAYSMLGHNYNILDEEASTPATCTETGIDVYKCVCGASTEVVTPTHTLNETTVTKAPTAYTKGEKTGECTVCHETITREIDLLDIYDYAERLTPNNATFTESLVETDEVKASGSRLPEAVLDGIVATNPWGGERNYWAAPTGSTLTITFDEEYLILITKLYAYSNYNSCKIEFFDAEGEAVYTYQNFAFQNYDGSPIIMTNDLTGKKVKSIVITAVGVKGDGSTTMFFSEFEILAHVCEFDDEAMTNVTEGENCEKTFDATCTVCEWAKTGVTRTFHDNVRDTEVADNYLAATCVKPGYEHVVCQTCGLKQEIIEYATGIHDFKDGKISYTDGKAPTCGTSATGRYLCNVCSTSSDELVDFPATGNHSYKWTVTTESTYTKKGIQENICTVCSQKDPDSKKEEADLLVLKSNIKTSDYTIRYTDFVGTRVTYKLDLSKIQSLEDMGYDVTVTAKVTNSADVTKEVIIYSKDKKGNYDENKGTFSVVVKNASTYKEEYKYSVEMTVKDKYGTAQNSINSKDMSTNSNSAVSIYEVAYYYVKKQASKLKGDQKDFYQSILDKCDSAK